MNVGIFGATGTIGSRVLAEAVGRGHKVRAFARDASRIPADLRDAEWKIADILDTDAVRKSIAGLDVLVSAFGPGPKSNATQTFTAQEIEAAVAKADTLVAAARSLLGALAAYPSLRLIVVGGAASLEVAPGLQAVDWDGLGDALKQLNLPPSYKGIMEAHRVAMNHYRMSDRNWTYFSPAIMIAPGERTGRFRLGTNSPVMGADGMSRISAEDYAVALVDEIELPQFVQRRFTVGY